MINPEDVIKILEEISLMNNKSIEINENSLILNSDNNLDSMALVQLCIALEENQTLWVLILIGHQKKPCHL